MSEVYMLENEDGSGRTTVPKWLYDHVVEIEAKLKAAKEDARVWKRLFDDILKVEGTLRAGVARMTQDLTNMTYSNDQHRKTAESWRGRAVRADELESEVARLKEENSLMAAHQGIDNHQRLLDRIAELEAGLEEALRRLPNSYPDEIVVYEHLRKMLGKEGKP